MAVHKSWAHKTRGKIRERSYTVQELIYDIDCNQVSPLTSTTIPSGQATLGFLIKPSVFLITTELVSWTRNHLLGCVIAATTCNTKYPHVECWVNYPANNARAIHHVIVFVHMLKNGCPSWEALS